MGCGLHEMKCIEDTYVETIWVVCEGEIEIRVTILTAGDAGMHKVFTVVVDVFLFSS